MGPVLRGITDLDQDMARFGLLPYMATTCKGSIGACLASSFCERVNSIAKAVMTLDRTLLDGEEMDMLTVLRASKDFIEFMRTNFAHVSEQEFCQTVVGQSEGRRRRTSLSTDMNFDNLVFLCRNVRVSKSSQGSTKCLSSRLVMN